MNNYTLNIGNVSFEKQNGDVTLSITLTGNFPEPANTSGSLVNQTVKFDLSSGSGAIVQSAVFTFQIGTGYPGNFEFINYPQGYSGNPISGEIHADNNEECEFELEESAWGDSITEGLGAEEGKDLKGKLRKKPGIASYAISSFGLTDVEVNGELRLSAVMTLREEAEDQLEATCDQLVNFAEIGQALPIVTINESGDNTPRSIGVIYVNN